MSAQAARISGEQSNPAALTRLRHRCGRFLGELRNGTVYVHCARCKDLVEVQLDQHRIVESELGTVPMSHEFPHG